MSARRPDHPVPVGVGALLLPKLQARIQRTVRGERRLLRTLVLGGAALGFWGLLYTLVARVLVHFRGAEGIGDLLAGKLLGMVLLTFLMILLLSNVITALSTFFLARDLEMLAASPVDPLHLYGARLVESGVNSSWMVALLLVPLVAAYGVTYAAGAGFYLVAVASLLPLLVLPAVFGGVVTLALVRAFPARRTRDLLALVGVLAAAGVVVLLRMLRPERFVSPDEFRSLVDFMASLRTPSSPWLPSEWAASAMTGWLTGHFDPFPLLLLAGTAAAFVVVGAWVHGRWYRSGFSRAQEGEERREGRIRSRGWERAIASLGLPARELVAKEVRVFRRDSTQWSQLLLLGVLVVVYVYNVQVLPVSTEDGISFFLVNLVAFLNLGLAGFVVAAIAARFIFPAMSLEGRMTWLLRSSPLDPRTLYRVKYWVGTIPLLVIALPLILTTNLLLSVSPLLMALSTVTMAGATLALGAMALAFGAVFPNLETENPAEIPTSLGGLLFMMAAVTYLVAVVALQAWPVHGFLRARLERGGGSGVELVPLLAGVGGAALLTVLAITLSFRVGLRAVGGAPGGGVDTSDT